MNDLFELLDYWKSVKYCPSKDECGSDDLLMNLLGLGISAQFWLRVCNFAWQILIQVLVARIFFLFQEFLLASCCFVVSSFVLFKADGFVFVLPS